MGRKKKDNIYFGPDVEEAIAEFNNETVSFRRDKIFNTRIYPALNKLSENVVNTWKFWRYETTYADLKNDLVSHLYERLHLVSAEKGKAYSFFTICLKNYCLQKNQALYKESLRHGDLIEVDEQRNLHNEVLEGDRYDDLKHFIHEFSDWGIENLESIFKSKKDRKVADAILSIFKYSGEIELFNKKELYVLIREHSKVDTQYITRVSTILKTIFYKMFDSYRRTGILDGTSYL